MAIQNRKPYFVAWNEFEDRENLDIQIRIMQDLKVPEIRTAFSWADWERPGGKEWFDYFIKRFSDAHIRLMPCLFYTPIEKARGDSTSYPPKRLADYADFTRRMIENYGDTFEWLQLWNEANWNVYWNWEADPEWKLFAEMVDGAIDVAKEKNKKVVLGGLSPYEPEWVDKMFDYGVMQKVDALGIHAFPGTWDFDLKRSKGRPWKGLAAEVELAREQLRKKNSSAEVWLTETGYSTYDDGNQMDREQKQIAYFDEVCASPADRAFWYTIVDQKEETPTDNELNAGLSRDPKAYHFGVVDNKGNKKPLYKYWRAL